MSEDKKGDPWATWDPSLATDEPDGLPDRLMVPLVEELRRLGVVTYQSCQGHPGQSGCLWVESSGLTIRGAQELSRVEGIEQVGLVFGRERVPVWEVVWHPGKTTSVLPLLRAKLVLRKIFKRPATNLSPRSAGRFRGLGGRTR